MHNAQIKNEEDQSSTPCWIYIVIALLAIISLVLAYFLIFGNKDGSSFPALKDGQMTIGYFGMQGRAAAVMQVLSAGVDKHGHKAYKVDEALLPKARGWADREGFGLKDGVPDAEGMKSTFMGLPVIVDESTGVQMSQTANILNYLGEKYGMQPTGFENKCLAKQYIADQQDLFNEMLKPAYVHKDEMKAAPNQDKQKITNAVKDLTKKSSKSYKWLELMERQIQGPYYFGAEPTYVDYALVGVLDVLGDVYEEAFKKLSWEFPRKDSKLNTIYSKIKNTKSYATVQKTTPVKWHPGKNGFHMKIDAANMVDRVLE